MEVRTIAIANTKTQRRYTIQSNAETLGQLKTQLLAQGIDIAGMTFTEGITKTQFISDDALLPTNVNYKGQITNNLVMLLTNPNKQIASGATIMIPNEKNRKNAYATIKEMGSGIQEEIKARYGKNYTQVKTDDLWKFILSSAEETVAEPDVCSKEITNPKDAPHANTVNWIYDGIKTMVTEHALYTEDVVVLHSLIQELANRLVESSVEITDEVIDDILSDIL